MIATLLLAAFAQDVVKFPLQRFALDPATSSIRFLGESTLHDFEGVAKSMGGEVRVDPAAVGASAGGMIWVDAKTLDTDNSSRDEDMRETLKADRYPRIFFWLDRAEGTLVDWNGKLQTSGRFDVSGVEAPRSFRLAITPGPQGGFHAKGKSKLSLAEHKLEPPSVLFISMDDAVEVRFDVEFAPVAAKPVPARVRPLAVAANPRGSPPMRVWSAGDAHVLDLGDGTYALARDGALTCFDARQGRRLAAKPSAEESLESLRGKPEYEARRRDAPADKPAEVDRDTPGAVIVKIGDVEWMRAEGLAGDERFGLALSALEGLPKAVRKVLSELRGVPAHLVLHTASAAGTLVLDLTVAAPQEATLPDWILVPATWTAPAR